MDLEPAYAQLRARARQRTSTTRASASSGSCAAGSAGPHYYTDRFGHPMLRARHLPQSIGGHSIGIKERDQWLACMDQAMGETERAR